MDSGAAGAGRCRMTGGAGGELPVDQVDELARILNGHVSGYRTGGARNAAAAILRAGYRRQEPTVQDVRDMLAAASIDTKEL